MRFLVGLGAALAGLGYAIWRLFLRADGIPADHPSTAITPDGASFRSDLFDTDIAASTAAVVSTDRMTLL